MLLIKRLLTGCITFPILIIVIWLGSLMIGGGILGGIAGAKNPKNAQEAGRIAGENFGKKYGLVLLFASVGLSGLASGTLMFVSPWCRSRKEELTE